MRTRSLNKFIVLMFVTVLLAACDSNKIYEENHTVDSDGWHNDDIKSFEFEIEDTISPLSLFVNVRTTTDYKYSNLYVFYP